MHLCVFFSMVVYIVFTFWDNSSNVGHLINGTDKMSVLPSLIHRSNARPTKNHSKLCYEYGQTSLKFIWRGKRPRMVNRILKEKSRVLGQMLPNFKLPIKLQSTRQSGIGTNQRSVQICVGWCPQWNAGPQTHRLRVGCGASPVTLCSPGIVS